MALTLAERQAAAERSHAYMKALDYRRILTEFGDLPIEELAAEPELGVDVGNAWYWTGERDRALDVVVRLTDACRRAGHERSRRRRTAAEAAIRYDLGQMERAEAMWLELIELAARADDHMHMAHACMGLGVLASLRCAYQDALAHFQRAAVGYQRLGLVAQLAIVNINIGVAFREIGYFAEADARLRKAEAYARDGNFEVGLIATRMERAHLLSLVGDPQLAEVTARLALATAVRSGDAGWEAEVWRVLAIIARRRGRRAEAREHLAAARACLARGRRAMIEAEVWEETAILEYEEGNEDAAAAARETAIKAYLALGTPARAERLRRWVPV